MAQGPKMAAIRADLGKMGKKVLLVEGLDDWHAFGHLIRAATGTFPSYELGYCDNDDGVLDILHGITEASRQTQSVLGAVLDTDQSDSGVSGIQCRVRSLQGRLSSYYAIPNEFPPEGLILPPMAEWDKDRLPILGIWLMPDNLRDGLFEDLLRAAIEPATEKYIACIVDQAKQDEIANFRDVERSKAIVKTHIAWQDPNKKNLGEALAAHFKNLSPVCTPFLDWLGRLFTASAQ